MHDYSNAAVLCSILPNCQPRLLAVWRSHKRGSASPATAAWLFDQEWRKYHPNPKHACAETEGRNAAAGFAFAVLVTHSGEILSTGESWGAAAGRKWRVPQVCRRHVGQVVIMFLGLVIKKVELNTLTVMFNDTRSAQHDCSLPRMRTIALQAIHSHELPWHVSAVYRRLQTDVSTKEYTSIMSDIRLTCTVLQMRKGSCKYVSVLRVVVELAHLFTRSRSFCHLVCSSFIILGGLSPGTLSHVLSLFCILYCVMFNSIAVCVAVLQYPLYSWLSVCIFKTLHIKMVY
jgi:hypothetical protein